MNSSPSDHVRTSTTQTTHTAPNVSANNQHTMSANTPPSNNVGLYGSNDQPRPFMSGATMPLQPQYVEYGDNIEQHTISLEDAARAAFMDALAKEEFGDDNTAAVQNQGTTLQIQDTIFQNQTNAFHTQDTTFSNLSQGNNLGFSDQTSVYGDQNLNKAAGGYQASHFNYNNLTQDNAFGFQGPNFNQVQAQSKRPAPRASNSNAVQPEINGTVSQASANHSARRQIKRPVSRISTTNHGQNVNNGIQSQIKRPVSRASVNSHGQNTQSNGYVYSAGLPNAGFPTVADINPNDAKRFNAYNMQQFSASGPSTQHISQPQQYNTVNTNISSQNFGPATPVDYFSQNQNQFVGNQQQFIIQNATPGTTQNNVSLDENVIKSTPTYKILQKQAIELCNLIKQARTRLAKVEEEKKTACEKLEAHINASNHYRANIKAWEERNRKQNMLQQEAASRLQAENEQLRTALANAGIEFQFQEPPPAATTVNAPAQLAGQKRKASDDDNIIDLTSKNDASPPASTNSAEQTASSSPTAASGSDSTPAATTTTATTPAGDTTNGAPPPKRQKKEAPAWLKQNSMQPAVMREVGMFGIDESRKLESEVNIKMNLQRIAEQEEKRQAQLLAEGQAKAQKLAEQQKEKEKRAELEQRKAAKRKTQESEEKQKEREAKEKRVADAKARKAEEAKQRKADAKKAKEEEKREQKRLEEEEQERLRQYDRDFERDLEKEQEELALLLSDEVAPEGEWAAVGAGAYNGNEIEELPEQQAPAAYYGDEESEVSEEE